MRDNAAGSKRQLGYQHPLSETNRGQRIDGIFTQRRCTSKGRSTDAPLSWDRQPGDIEIR
jgi:hypothetical protein